MKVAQPLYFVNHLCRQEFYCTTLKCNCNHTQTEDCVNGTWFPNNFNGGSTNYSFLTAELAKRREMAEYREETISYEPDITIFNKTK